MPQNTEGVEGATNLQTNESANHPRLGGLCIRVWRDEAADDVVVIFADPSEEDLTALLQDASVLTEVKQLLLGQGVEAKSADSTAVTCSDVEPPATATCSDVELPATATCSDAELTVTEEKEFAEVKLEENSDLSCSKLNEVKDFNITESVEDKVAEDKENQRMEPKNKRKVDSAKNAGKSKQVDSALEHIEKTKDGKFMCKLCNNTFKYRYSARKHVRLHGIDQEPEEERTCPLCHKVAPTRERIQLHIKKQVCTNRNKTSCDECGLSFENNAKFREHNRLVHCSDGHQCRFCQFRSDSRNTVRIHENSVHLNLKCRVCKRIFNEATELEAHHPCQPKVFDCDQCGKGYKSKANLNEHKAYAHTGVRYRCEVCEVELSGGGIVLERHMKVVHGSQVRKFKCDYCDKSFKTSVYLKSHLKTHDANTEKAHLCTDCGKKFLTKQSLTKHVDRIHRLVADLRHVCEDCGRGFDSPSSLQCHAEYAHKKGESCMCQLCGQEIVGRIKLKKHMARYHSPGFKYLNCEICGKTVPETQLKSHIVADHKSHTFKFQCDICHMKFPTKPVIRMHTRKHTGARPYVCHGCDRCFVKLQSARKHVRQSHHADYSLLVYDVNKDFNNPYVVTASNKTKKL